MMEVYFLSGTLARLAGPIEEVRSLVLSERYRECGSFSMELPLSLAQAASEAAFVEFSGHAALGRVERLVFDEEKAVLSVSGRTAESLLADRIILRGTTASGTAETVIRAVLSANAVGTGAGDRKIPHLTLGSITGLDSDTEQYRVGYAEAGTELDTWLRSVLYAADASYRIVLNETGDALVLEIYRGLDRTQEQTTNSFAVFSASFASIGGLCVTCDDTEYKNYAYVAGEGDGEERTTAEIDLRASSDEPLKELYLDARDIRSDDGETVMSADAYLKALLARGRERLSSHERVQRLEGMTASTVSGTDAFGSMRAGVDFSLGDRCDIVCE